MDSQTPSSSFHRVQRDQTLRFWGLEVGVWLIGILFAFAAFPAHAATVCCDCSPKGDTKTTCLTIDATKLQNADNCSTLPADAKLPEGWTCKPAKLTESACKKIVSGNTAIGGVCSVEPASAFSIAANAVAKSTASAAKPVAPIPFALNVPIPGFTAQSSVDGNLFGQYLYAIFRYAISIAAIAATIMFIYGAFRYLVGSAVGGIARGKEIMTDAIIGFLLLISSTMILRTLNPALVKLNVLEPMEIRTELVGNYSNEAIPPQSALSRTGYKPQNAEELILTGARLVPGVDPCSILALCQIESGLRQQWNGQYAGNPKEKAHAFGPCQQEAQFLFGTSPYAKLASALFKDFPISGSTNAGTMTSDEKQRVGDWLIRNYIGAGYIAALNFRANLRDQNNNEIAALAGYYGGSGSLKAWKKAHSCTPVSGLKMSSGVPGNMEKDACVPEFVAITQSGNPAASCPNDGYACPAKQDKTSQFVGACSDGTPCKAARVAPYARNIVNVYQSLAGKHDCSLGTGDASQLAGALQQQGQTTTASGALSKSASVLLIGDSLSVGLAGRLGSDIRKTGASFSGIGEVGTYISDWARGKKHAALTQGLSNHPSIVIVSLGTNDEYLSADSGRAESDELASLISQIQSSGASIYWIGPPPLPATYNGHHPSGVVIPMIVATAGSSNVKFFPGDQLDIPRQSEDKLHPTVEGYGTWADLVFNWLQSN
jgi:hypothetical protein